jgi:outer membrane protein insertion porin family
MIKNSIKILSIYFFLMTNLYSEIITNVDITGNQRISKSTILVLGNITLGDDFDDNKVNQSLKKLYESNFFKEINIKLKDGVVKIAVTENPIIESIVFSGVKSNEFEKKIAESIVLKNRMSFTEDQLQRDIILIENILKSNGYYFSKVDVSLSKNSDLNSVKLNLNIDTGDKAKIKKISFIGDKKIKDKKLLEIIASEEHKFWKFISKKVYVNQSIIDLDKRLLENYYRNLGYHKVKVLNSFAEFDKKGYFKLIFNINAGKKFYFNELSLNLPDDYDINDFTKVEKIFKKVKGEKYSLDALNSIIDEIDKIASSRLYDFIDAKVDEIIVDVNKINFVFNVVDSKKNYVERINILGNFNTIEEVIRNKFVVDEGDPLNSLLYKKSINNVRSLGIFKKVDAKIRNGSNDSLKIIDVIVEEKPTGEVMLAAGIGTSGSTVGAGIKEKNFLGKGINLATDFEISEDGVKGKFVYSKPNFAYTDNTLFTSLSSDSTDNLSDFGYKVTNTSFSIGTEFQQYENLYFRPEIDLSFEDLKTNSNASSGLKKQHGTYNDLFFNYGLRLDLRNSSYKPSSGNNTAFYQQLPIISDNNEISNSLVFTQYKSLNDASEMVGKASFYFKAINSIDGSDVRISRRAKIPYHRLRGFEKGKVGPVDNGDYVGGNYVTAINLSTNLPQILNTVENLDFSYFIDVANVWGVDYDSSIDDSGKFRSSTGIGLDFLTPIGPLSFSLAHPITNKSSDKTETFRFNLGTTF